GRQGAGESRGAPSSRERRRPSAGGVHGRGDPRNPAAGRLPHPAAGGRRGARVTDGSDSRLFAAGPARDDRFTVKALWTELVNLPEDPREAPREFLHRKMSEEINGLEISARNLVDFPGADWELRLSIARQCADEARHVEMFRRCFESRGGKVGQYPVLDFQY